MGTRWWKRAACLVVFGSIWVGWPSAREIQADEKAIAMFDEKGGEALDLAARDLSPEMALDVLGERARLVRMRSEAAVALHAESPPRLYLELFSDAKFEVDLKRVEPVSEGGRAWQGKGVDGGSRLDMVERDGATVRMGTMFERVPFLVGSLTTATGRAFRFETWIADGAVLVQEIGSPSIPECATTAEHVVMLPGRDQRDVPALTPKTFEVLVAYTPKAADLVGGDVQILAKIDLAVLEANGAYQNSGIMHSIHLAKTMRVDDDERGGLGAILDALTADGDGRMDSVHSERNTADADLVSLFVANNEACGLGWVMGTPSPVFAAKAFSLVNVRCATGYYSFAHELAHNMGCCHDKPNAGGGCAGTDCYGWRFTTSTGEKVRTIMAYPQGNPSDRRIQHFSNPNKTFGGATTGAQDAHNARVINDNGPTVANWR